jgi:MobA/VirD2-like, nuclease domain
VIGKISGGASFGGALEYLTKAKSKEQEERLKETKPDREEHAPAYREGERHRIIGGNMSSDTRAELAREFEAIREQRPDIKKPVHHASISADEKDKISVDQWREIAAEYVEKMGFKDAPYVVIQHRDGGKDHVHILTSRVDVRGNVVSDWKCKERAENLLREMERERGLVQVKPSREVEHSAPKRWEYEKFKRTGQLSVRMALQGHVEHALKDSPTFGEFVERLQVAGVETVPYVQKDGRATGVSFRKGKELMKGGDLGRGYTFPALQRRGLDYQPERDRALVEATRERALGRTEPTPAEPPVQQAERTFVDHVKDIGREAGDYLIDRANPVHQLENQARTIEQLGRSVAEGISALQNVASRQSEIEQSQRTTTLDDSSRAGVERLQQSAGVDPLRDARDGLDRLSSVPGLEREDPTATALDKATPELMPALEIEAEEHVLAPVFELML